MSDLIANLQRLGDYEHDDLSVAFEALAEIIKLRLERSALLDRLDAAERENERLQVGIELINAENADLLTRLDLESGTVGMIARECADLRRQLDECSQMLARQAATIRELTRPTEES